MTYRELPAQVQRAMRYGWRLVEHPNPHALRAKLRRDMSNGRALRASPMFLHGAQFCYVYEPAPGKPPVWRKWTAVAVVALASAWGLGLAVWFAIPTLWAILVKVGILALAGSAVMFVLTVFSGHRAGCTGLHCSGCRG